MSLIGKKAPDFTAKAVKKGEVIENFKLSDHQGKYVVMFFYPLDFTFVCPTELHAFQDKLSEFQQRNTEVIAVSTDSHFSHMAWLNTPKSQGGIEGVEYPIVADFNKTISRDFDVLVEEEGVAFRGLFLMDKEGVVHHAVLNNLPLGRSVDEALRMVDALQHFEEHGEVCPANWQQGEKSMKANNEGLKEYFGG